MGGHCAPGTGEERDEVNCNRGADHLRHHRFQERNQGEQQQGRCKCGPRVDSDGRRGWRRERNHGPAPRRRRQLVR